MRAEATNTGRKCNNYQFGGSNKSSHGYSQRGRKFTYYPEQLKGTTRKERYEA